MKKILTLAIASFLALPFVSFAVETTATIGGTGDTAVQSVRLGPDGGTGEIFRVSTNVVIEVASDLDAYAATSGHLQGTRQYGTTSSFNNILEGEKDKGASPTAPTDKATLDTDAFPDFPVTAVEEQQQEG